MIILPISIINHNPMIRKISNGKSPPNPDIEKMDVANHED